MFLFHVLLAASLAASAGSLHAQGLAGEPVGSAAAGSRVRYWLRSPHTRIPDRSVLLRLPRRSNPWLSHSYEFVLPAGCATGGLRLFTSRCDKDSLCIDCNTGADSGTGYRLLFCREGNRFSFSAIQDFRVFRSGVERICQVSFSVTGKAGYRLIRMRAGTGACSYVRR